MGCIRNRRKNQFAAIGIGAMIVFIAMVLVAGIAASVLFQTSTRLEMQALQTGQETITDTSTGVTVYGVEGFNESGLIKKLAIEITPKAGSPDMDLENTIIEISDGSEKHILSFGGSGEHVNSSEINGDIETNGKFGGTTTFGITVLQDADESCTSSTPIIGYGDHVILGISTSDVFSTNSGLSPRTDIEGMILIEEGAPGIIGFTTPSSYVDSIIELQ
ncbi:MAG: flagellin [Candidatus Thermoplasmatota archaeon]|nr:flagellin [Candidatus Thermoplasmatota archaeon]